MKFTELTDKEFMEFVKTRPENNFFQTVMMKDRIKNEGIEVYLVGVKENEKVIGASFIAATPHTFMGYRTFEAYKGFILDYENKELVKFMTDEVKKFLSDKKYQIVLFTANYRCKEKFVKINVKEYDYTSDLSNEKLVYSGKWFKQIELDINFNKIYVYELTFKDNDYVQYTFNTYCN